VTDRAVPGGAGSLGGTAIGGSGTTAGTTATGPSVTGPGAAQNGGSGSRAPRERRLRRKVHRLAPCLDEVSSLERRVLVLRSGLGRRRPHSRGATAKRLGISVQRTARAERRGLAGIARANRASGCGYGGGGSSSGVGGFAVIAESAPIVAQAIGIAPTPSRDRQAVEGQEESGFADGPLVAPDLIEAAEGAAIAAKEEGALPFVFLLGLVATLLALVAVTRGRRVAGDVLERRAEQATERRHNELVTAVRNILGERK
jgi:hypothetical protein